MANAYSLMVEMIPHEVDLLFAHPLQSPLSPPGLAAGLLCLLGNFPPPSPPTGAQPTSNLPTAFWPSQTPTHASSSSQTGRKATCGKGRASCSSSSSMRQPALSRAQPNWNLETENVRHARMHARAFNTFDILDISSRVTSTVRKFTLCRRYYYYYF